MATTKARTVLVPIRNIYDTDDAVNTAVETLEATGWVANAVQFVETLDTSGLPCKVAIIHLVSQDYMPPGLLTADAAGRSRMAAGYFGAGVAASAAQFADGFWTNSLIAKFADGLFAAADASRNKFAAGFFGLTATAQALFVDGFWTATTAARDKFADLFLTDVKLAQDRGKTAGLTLSGITPSTDITGGAATRDINVDLDGIGAHNCEIAKAGLNSGALIAAALQVSIRAAHASAAYTLAEVRYDAASGRYLVTSGTRGSTSSVALAAGTGADVGAELCLLTANGGVAIPGCDNLDHARGQAAQVLGSQSVATAHLRSGALSADAAGRLKMADDFLTEEKINTDVRLTRAQVAMDITTPPTAAAGRGVVVGVGAEGAVTPLAVPAMSVRVVTGGTVVSHRGRKATCPTSAGLVIAIADAVNPRWDVVVCTEAGVLTVREGAAAGAPADPALTAGDVPLARVVVPAMAGTITADGAAGTGWIEDLRSRQGLSFPLPAQSCGLPGGSLDISAAGVNADLRVNVNGAGLVALTVPNPAAFSIGGAAAVALNSAALIVAAYNQLAAQAGQACIFSYDPTTLRYYVTSRLLGGNATVVIAAGLVNNIADDLLLGTTAGGEEHAGTDALSTASVRGMANPAPRSVDTVALADGALAATVAGLAKMAAGFLQASANGRAKLADAYFTIAEVIGGGAGAKFAAGARPAVHRGAPMQDRLFLATLPLNADWISVQGTDGTVVPIEFRDNTPPTGGTAGRIWVYRGVAAANARINLADALSGVVDAARIAYNVAAPVGYTGIDIPGDTVVLYVETVPSETPRNVTENLDAAADIWDAAATYGGMLDTRQRFAMKQITIDADQVTAGEVQFHFDFGPMDSVIINHARPQNEAWAIVANDVRLVLAGGATPNNQAGDVVTCIAIG